MQSSIIHKLLKMLAVISEATSPMSFSEIVERTGLNKSTIHRLLSIGIEEKLVQFDSHRKVYLLGSCVFDLVRNAHKGYDIQAIALDEMVRLYDLYDVNVTVGVPSGVEVVYLRVLDSRQSMGGVQRPGMREPVHCSASGKALLAYYPDKVLESLLSGHTFERFTERTITSLEAFKGELAFVRENGFGRNDREEYETFLGISAPIFNYLGEAIAVLNLWSIHPRHTMKDLEKMSGELKFSAGRVTGLIGGVGPDITTGMSS